MMFFQYKNIQERIVRGYLKSGQILLTLKVQFSFLCVERLSYWLWNTYICIWTVRLWYLGFFLFFFAFGFIMRIFIYIPFKKNMIVNALCKVCLHCYYGMFTLIWFFGGYIFVCNSICTCSCYKYDKVS